MSNKGIEKKTGDAADQGFTHEAAEAKYKKWFPDLTQGVINQLVEFHSLLEKLNKTLNLVPPETLKKADQVHFADSILASRIIRKAMIQGAPLYDIGGGNGFPGLIFGILYPDSQVILVDRDSRKLDFGKHVASALKASNVSTMANAVEDLPNASIKNAVTRGLAALPRSLLLCRKQIAQGGKFFHMKGDGWANELAQVPSQLFTFWSPSLLGQYRLPESSTENAVVLTDKIAE